VGRLYGVAAACCACPSAWLPAAVICGFGIYWAVCAVCWVEEPLEPNFGTPFGYELYTKLGRSFQFSWISWTIHDVLGSDHFDLGHIQRVEIERTNARQLAIIEPDFVGCLFG